MFESRQQAHEHYWYPHDIPRPRAARRQFLSFRYRSHDMMRHGAASHWAIALHARLVFDDSGRPVSISGRGMTLGDTSGAVAPADDPHARVPGFGGARGAGLESYWPGGNYLYATTHLADDGLRDETWYRVRLVVDDELRIALELGTEGGPTEAASVVDSPDHPVIADAHGALITLARGPIEVETGPWWAEFRDIEVGWE